MNATAYYVGLSDDLPAASKELAKEIGFCAIKKFTTLTDVERQILQTPICFFIFDQVPDIKQLQSIVKPIRSCKRHNIRFSALIYLCNIPSPNTIREGIVMGFDDVIAKPFDGKKAKLRVESQIDKIIPYFETDQYFGPDRRRLQEKQPALKTENRNKKQYHHYKFIRDLKTGIIIKDKKILLS